LKVFTLRHTRRSHMDVYRLIQKQL
jgi:hypothetical protein